MNKDFAEDVYNAVKSIPRGKVASYGQVALMSGCVGAARAVGRALHHNRDPDNVPCHRVVFADGACSSAFAFGGANMQMEMLKKEGVEFKDGKVKREFFL